MSLLKYIDRMKRMDQLIRMKATGTPDQFSEKMGICKSVLLDHIREMRQMGAPIEYCSHRQSYCYKEDCKLVIDFSLKELMSVRGGLKKSFLFNQLFKQKILEVDL